MEPVVLTSELIEFESTSALSNVAISDHVENWLNRLSFEVERLEYDDARGVRKCNLVAKRGNGTGGLAYFCHTDVVPAKNWRFADHGPYAPTVRDDKLFGRGSCDMKGSLACFLAAVARVSDKVCTQPIYFVATADEEVGNAGAADVARRSTFFREMVTAQTPAIIGEPTRLQAVHAHKGCYGFRATARGKAAHSSTRHGVNANLAMIPFLAEMKAIHDETMTNPDWQHAEFDPPVLSWNIGINDHTPAVNITPPQSVCTVYFRPMPGQDIQPLLDRVNQAAEDNGISVEVMFQGPPFYLAKDDPFLAEICDLIDHHHPRTVSYGTDASMFLELRKMIVLGPGDIAQAHTHDEFIELEQLQAGTRTYEKLIRHYCDTA